jgi:Rrf2 family protein
MIKLSTKGRYATRIMVYLAMQEGDEPVKKQEISEAEGISPDYVVQLLMRLKAAGLVESRRGTNGGFLLAKKPARVTVADVLHATEGDTELVSCDEEGCSRGAACVSRLVWERASKALDTVFSEFTIEELAKKARALRLSTAVTFQI